MVDNAPKEIDIEHVYSITYVPTMNEFGAIYDSIVFLRIGVFLDLFEYLCNRPRISGVGLGNKLRIFTPNPKKFNLDKMKREYKIIMINLFFLHIEFIQNFLKNMNFFIAKSIYLFMKKYINLKN